MVEDGMHPQNCINKIKRKDSRIEVIKGGNGSEGKGG
jgi:hypothetical protein